MCRAVLLLLFSASLASALSCYYDYYSSKCDSDCQTFLAYNNYNDMYNEQPKQCSYFTNSCYMTTTMIGNNTYRRVADCDSSTPSVCGTFYSSGCTTQGQTVTCCCRTNYCNNPSGSGSGYSAVLPMIFSVLSYPFL